MPTLFRFVHPDELVIGKRYYLRETSLEDSMPKYNEVTLIDANSSDEFVTILYEHGLVERCAWADLYIKSIVGTINYDRS